MQRLEYYGICGVANKLLHSYLNGCIRYVDINGSHSTTKSML